jgi:hypothetical protein
MCIKIHGADYLFLGLVWYISYLCNELSSDIAKKAVQMLKTLISHIYAKCQN